MIPNTNIKVAAIAIISKNRGLGLENKLLFSIPGELPRFKELTLGHPIIMGRKTFDSIGRVLPGRTNIIITRDSSYKVEGAVVVSSLEEALKVCSKYLVASSQSKQNTSQPLTTNYQLPATDEVFIIGGGQIFQEALPFTDRLYLTVVDKEVPADTFFPDYSAFTQTVTKEEKTDWDYPYTFLTLER